MEKQIIPFMIQDHAPNLPTAEEVVEAKKAATEARAKYKDAVTAYRAQAERLATLKDRAESIGTTDGTKTREGLIAKAVSAVGDYLTGKDNAHLPTSKEIEQAAADEIRAEIVAKVKAKAMETVKAQELETAKAAVMADEAHEYAAVLHVRYVVSNALLSMAKDAAAITATVHAFGWDVANRGGVSWETLGKVWPAGEANPILGSLPARPELGDTMTAREAERIIEAHDTAEREARNAALQAESESRQAGMQYFHGAAAHAISVHHLQ